MNNSGYVIIWVTGFISIAAMVISANLVDVFIDPRLKALETCYIVSDEDLQCANIFYGNGNYIINHNK